MSKRHGMKNTWNTQGVKTPYNKVQKCGQVADARGNLQNILNDNKLKIPTNVNVLATCNLIIWQLTSLVNETIFST